MDFAKQHEPDVQVTVTKPGAILAPGQEAMPAPTTGPFAAFAHTPSVTVAELAAAMIDQCLNGITKDPLWASDLVEIGQACYIRDRYAIDELASLISTHLRRASLHQIEYHNEFAMSA